MSEVNHAGEPMAFEVFGRKIAAKRWGSSAGKPMMMLHGWLDNANTFDRLAPLLPGLDLVALDFAGHGESDHRAAGTHYHQIDDVQDVLSVAEQLGWDKFGLIGHSMGAQIASELAALFPERIECGVMLDGFVATGGSTHQERVEQNRAALEKMLSAGQPTLRVFDDVESMATYVSAATDQSVAATRLLVERGHKRVEGGITWCTDPRIRFPSPLRYTRNYLNELLSQCSVPCFLLVAEQGSTWYQGEIEVSQKYHPNLIVQHMPGPHHIHLEPEYVAEVAAHVRRFLGLGEMRSVADRAEPSTAAA